MKMSGFDCFEPYPVLLKNNPIVTAVHSVAIVYTTIKILGISYNVSLIIAPLIVISIYTLDDVIGGPEDAVNQKKRKRLVDNYSAYFLIISCLCYFLATLLVFLFSGIYVIPLLILPLIVLILYTGVNIDALPIFHFKRIMVLNTLIIAATWAMIPAGVVLVSSESVPITILVGIMLFWLFRVSIGTETCNIVDVIGDSKQNITTLPTKYGIRSTKFVLYTLEIVSVLILLLLYRRTGSAYTLVILPSILYSTVVVSLVGKNQTDSLLCFASDLHVTVIGALALTYSILQ